MSTFIRKWTDFKTGPKKEKVSDTPKYATDKTDKRSEEDVKVLDIPLKSTDKTDKRQDKDTSGSFGSSQVAYPQNFLPKEAVMKEHKADIIAALSIPRLPWQLERLVSAATNDQLPKGMVKLEAGLVSDLNTYVLAWSASYLLGGSDEALTRLWQARKAWQGTVAA